METVIKSLNRYTVLGFFDLVPEYVIRAARREGFFSLGLVAKEDGRESLIGMAVFHVTASKEESCAEIVYVYVLEAYRRQGFGKKLLMGTDYITKKTGMRAVMALLPFDEDNGFGYALTENELNLFFIACGFVPVSERKDFRPSILGEFFEEKDVRNAAHWVRHFE